MIRGKGLIKYKILYVGFILFFISYFSISLIPGETAKKTLTFQDIMKFKEIHYPIISEDGSIVVYNSQPDRGNGEVMVHLLNKDKSYTLAKGIKPKLSKDGKWIATFLKPDALELEKDKKKKLKNGMALLNTHTGDTLEFKKVKSFYFSEDSNWLTYQLFPKKAPNDDKNKDKNQNIIKEEKEQNKKKKKEKADKWKKKISPVIIRNLTTAKEIRLEHILTFKLDPASHYVAYSVYDPSGKENGIYIRNLLEPGAVESSIHKETQGIYTNITWTKKSSKLAFLFHKEKNNHKNLTQKAHMPGLWLWDGSKKKLVSVVSKKNVPEGWMIPAENSFRFSKDEKRLFFGFKPLDEYSFYEIKSKKKKEEELTEEDFFNPDKIRAKRGLDVWHWNDGQINPQQKKRWDKQKKKTYLAVYHIKKKKVIQLADQELPFLNPTENSSFALGSTNQPYLKEMTWDDSFQDYYLINLNNGTKKKIRDHHHYQMQLSPNGKYVSYYKDKHWYLYHSATGKVWNLTLKIETPFFDEDHDYPEDVPSYGIAGWLEKDKGLLIYDKYDIWQFSTSTGKFTNLTQGEGRKNLLTFRLVKLDPESTFIKKDQKLLLTGYSHKEKHTIFLSKQLGKPGLKKLVQGKKYFRFLKKAKKANRILFTRECLNEFPDLWVSDLQFASPTKITNVNPQKDEFLWGSSELIDWKSLDGIPLQGIVIKPENYDPNKRYPVLVYYYRFFTQRLYRFNQMVVNHRPNFPFYASNGYVMFLPDIRFDIGRPGYSATKCLVPGVQKLIDLGIADPKAIALHGHSWSGYQTAFVITQTNIFAAAIAGAPVSNMTSAYSGIRWNSGMARQFQYEKSQSRIGKTLWDGQRLYIENSPVFFADRIETPLLIQHGDIDGAVPWYQSIELYLAMRRLQKDCVFLQYRQEPHHLKKYPNKVDYSMKMKEYLDHYLKGKPARDWIKKGVPYRKVQNN
jgi:dipeptidyl aminopeptidase/acylaminoacyl peptidase